jgi:arabinofuranan 3-O-arabinosyltransferase
VGTTSPALRWPWLADGAVLGTRSAIVTGVVTLVVASFLAGPWVGLATAVLAVVAVAVPKGQIVVRAACVGLFALAALYIVAKQGLNGYPLDFEWVKWFEITHSWALMATLLLVLDVVVDALRSGGTADSPD